MQSRQSLRYSLLLVLLLVVLLAQVNPALADDTTDLLALVNQKRAEAGITPLTLCSRLTAAAANHSNDMATRGFFSHDAPPPNASTPWSRIAATGYSYTSAAENIALGYETAQDVFNGWWNSSGHRSNMMNPAMQHLGIGTARGTAPGYVGAKFWTQVFGAGGSCGGALVDLAVLSFSDMPDPVVATRSLTYNATVKNNSANAASGVALTFTLPAGTTFTSSNPPGCTVSGSLVTCSVGSLAAGASATTSIVVTPSAAGSVIGQMSATSTSNPDPNTANNLASLTTVVAPPPPAPPSLTAPLGTFAGHQPEFTWMATAGAVRYELQIGTSNPPTTAPVSLTSNRYPLPYPLLLGTYYWRVRAFNAAGVPSDSWSAVGSVQITSAPNEAPVGDYYTSFPINLRWGRISWATGYEVQIDTSASFAAPTTFPPLPAGTLSLQVNTLADGYYYWRVCARNEAGVCQWSAADQFVVNGP